MKYHALVGVALAGAIATNAAQAASVTINTDNSVVATTGGLTGFQTFGDNMAGMIVTAFFSGGSSASATWGATGVGAGSAIAAGAFSLSEVGDTFDGTWTLINNSNVVLTGLKINAGAGDTVFDIDPFNTGTTGSAGGRPYTDTSGLGRNITATYSKIVALTGFSPVGDLFAIMNVDYTGLSGGGLGANATLTFQQDTDNLGLSGDLQTVPVPAALPLFVTGLGALGLFGWRRKRKATPAA